MERAIVPQNATAEVRPAPRTELKPDLTADVPPDVTADVEAGFASIGPHPPARTYAQTSSAAPTARRNGEPHVTRSLIDSIPRSTIHTLIAQKNRKHSASPVPSPTHAGRMRGRCAMPGVSTSSSLKIAKPPIHVWIPNQPHAT